MTYREYIHKHGVALPISGFEDLVFDYLEELNKQMQGTIPVEHIIDAIFEAQEVVPHIKDLNEPAMVDENFVNTYQSGGSNVH